MLIIGQNKTVEVDGLKFTVRPENYADLFRNFREEADAKAEKYGDDSEDHWLLTAVLHLHNRLVAWEGIGSAPNQPAELTEENLVMLVAMKPDIIGKIWQAYNDQGKSDQKNSDPSQGG